jgi:tRNA modification GTPase
MFGQLNDTIVAVSSPAGVGVRGIIRLSGPAAFSLAGQVFTCRDERLLADVPGHRRVMGRLWMEPEASVPAEAYVFRSPASYTRQDVIELHTIGSPAVLAAVLDRLIAAGARPAEPGEFTARAFFSGAMDLTRVEGVAAIIHARNDSQLRASEALLHGRLSRRSTELRERLTDLLALIEAEIDFSEEAVEFVSPPQVVEVVTQVCDELDGLIRHAPSAERLEVLPEVLMVGRPNAGKSTLMNRLTGADRAIRSAVPGTTRDILSVPLTVPGGEVMLLDAAGLDPLAALPAHSSDDPDGLAQSLVRRIMLRAGMILLVVDIADRPDEAIRLLRPLLPARPVCVLFTKIDGLERAAAEQVLVNCQDGGNTIAVSALTGEGLDRLQAEIGRTLFSTMESHVSDLLTLSDRQRQALCEARAALQRVGGICDQMPDLMSAAELLSMEIREAVNALSLLLGEVTTEDLLDRIFSRFCIGK